MKKFEVENGKSSYHIIYDKILENTRVINEINQQLGKADKATLKTLLSEKERLILSNHSLIEKVYNFDF